MKRSAQMAMASTLTVAACLICMTAAQGKKPGGGGGGGAAYSLVLISPAGVSLDSGGPTDVNDAGDLVGWFESTNGEHHAYCYELANDAFYALQGGTLAHGVNNTGEIVGLNAVSPGVADAVYWGSAQANAITLAGLSGATITVARSINEAGLISGHSIVDGAKYAVLWRTGDVDVGVVLPPLPGAVHADAIHVSEFSTGGGAFVVGYSSLTPGGDPLDAQATMWAVWIDGEEVLHSSDAIDLGVLTNGPSQALGVNSDGTVCGRSDWWPVVEFDGQPMQVLPTSSKAIGGHAGDINETGSIVGSVETYPRCCVPYPRAWLWSSGKGTDLNSKVRLGRSEVLEFASAISNAGHIVGIGEFDQANAGFALVPN